MVARWKRGAKDTERPCKAVHSNTRCLSPPKPHSKGKLSDATSAHTLIGTSLPDRQTWSHDSW